MSEPAPLLTLLSAVAQAERDALVAALERRGFSGVAMPAIRLIAEVAAAERSIQALADATGTTKQFCGREVARLKKQGYLAIAPSPDDKRATSVSLAARGKKLLEAVRQAKRELDAAMLRRLGAADVERLRRMLTRLVADAAARSTR